MRILSKADLEQALDYAALTRGLPPLLAHPVMSPPRHHHSIRTPDAPDGTLLLMPAWNARLGGIKIVNVAPGNGARNLPAVSASYIVFDAVTGQHLAMLDGEELTARRTAACAAIAANRLARLDASKLLIVGSGRIAAELAFAYRAVRPIEHVSISSRNTDHARLLAGHLRKAGFQAEVCLDRDACAPLHDIIACATLSTAPLIRGERMSAGQHVALLGGYRPDMREADDALIERSSLWVDTMTAVHEFGDLCQPLAAGLISEAHIAGTLAQICGGEGCFDPGVITVYKSVGEAAQDLAAAALALK